MKKVFDIPSDILQHTDMTTTNKVDDMMRTTMQKIAEAAAKQDLPAVTAHTRRAAELETLKKTLLGIEEKLKEFEEMPAQAGSNGTQPASHVRELPVEVTQGMINQNLLTLTAHVSRGRIKAGEDMTVETYPSGERFRTELLSNGNKLRERGAIGRFYREAGVHAGDFVVLTEVAPNHWTLKKAPVGQYRGRRSILDAL